MSAAEWIGAIALLFGGARELQWQCRWYDARVDAARREHMLVRPGAVFVSEDR